MNSQKDSTAGMPKTAQMLVLALLAATVIIGLVVYMTPLDKEASPEGSEPTATEPIDEKPLPLEGITDAERQELVKQEYAKLELPTEPLELEVASFQDELRDLAAQMVSTNRDDPGAYHFAAGIYSELKNTERAEATWRACIELGTTMPGPFAGLSEQLIAEGEETQAIAILQEARKRGINSEEISTQLATAYENSGDLEGALQVLNEGLLAQPSNATLLLSQARIHNQQGSFEEAEAAAKRALAMNFKSERALVMLSTALARQGKREEAVAIRDRLKEIQQEQKDEPQAQFQDSYDSALRAIGYQSYLSAAALAEQHGRWVLAQDRLRRAITIEPKGGEAYMSLSSVLRKQGQLLPALALHQKLVELQPYNVFNYSNLASLAWQLGDKTLAKETLEAGVQADPEGILNQSALARICLVEGDFAKAKQLAALVVERNRSVESFVLMATIYEAAGENDAAAAAFDEARRLNPNHPLLQPGATPNP